LVLISERRLIIITNVLNLNAKALNINISSLYKSNNFIAVFLNEDLYSKTEHLKILMRYELGISRLNNMKIQTES